MIKIPYGISGFERIRKQGYKYIDKTKYIREIEEEPYCMYVRPRRFGKTLFTTTLNAYYSIDKKDEYEELFKGLEIYNNPTENKNNYYIMNFDFSGMMINTQMDINEIEEAFNAVVYTHLKEFVNRYKLSIQVEKSITAAQMLKDCLGAFQGLHLQNNIYIIVDEYDHFTNGLLEGEVSGNIVQSFELDKTFSSYDFLSLLFYNGYITIKEVEPISNLVKFVVPNFVSYTLIKKMIKKKK